ncbi:MAG TPA: DUF418 domain-containing protein [Vicinamibacterales bacterium]|nr:DUF418 domain-containing protein [Vicinamibacterales bacterium]
MDTRPAPVTASDRHDVIDFLRGFAVLGILVMNIQSFAMPFAAYFNPTALGPPGSLDFAIWLVSHLFFDQKFMTIFSILFGAGIILMSTRVQERGVSAARLHYRRMAWLLIFGLLHAYAIWYGDILVLYAICGSVVFLCRRWRPRTLVVVGVLVLAVEPVLMRLAVASIASAPPEAVQEIRDFWEPSAALLQQEIAAFQGGWLSQMPKRIQYAWEFHSFEIWIWGFWRASGLMLIGMALLKWGVLTAQRDRDFYPRLFVAGWMLGLPIILFGVVRMSAANWEVFYSFFIGLSFNYWGSILVALGWIGLFVSLWLTHALRGLASRLVAVGRTAFSCYILTSLICTFIFYGHGLGLFGRVRRPGQILVTLIVWTILLIVAPLWLERFRFGPLEWLWRTLTYGQRQPMRRTGPAAAPAL